MFYSRKELEKAGISAQKLLDIDKVNLDFNQNLKVNSLSQALKIRLSGAKLQQLLQVLNFYFFLHPTEAMHGDLGMIGK